MSRTAGLRIIVPPYQRFTRREIGRRVIRGQNGTMVLRRTAAGVLEAERNFHKLVGYRAMPILIAALRAHDAQFNRTDPRVDDTDKAA